MMAGPKDDEQAGLWDLELDDKELEAACATLLDDKNREVMKKMTAAGNLRREKIRALEAQIRDTVGEDAFEANGARVRVGKYVIAVTTRTGGGFEIPEWSSIGVSSVNGAITSDAD